MPTHPEPDFPSPFAPLNQGLEFFVQIFEFAPDAKLLVDQQGRIIKANSQAELMFGYSRDELEGQLVEILIPQRFVGRHVSFRDGYMAAPRTRPMGANVDLFARRKDGTEIPVDIMLSPLKSEHGILALADVRDVSERKRAENQAREAREMYLKELHHRVKNNLQIISSLLYLQSTYTSDLKTLAILKESQSRVKTIALIHEKLYRSPDLTRIDFSEYVKDLVNDLFRAYGNPEESITIRMNIPDISLELDTAIPCGLMINELISNAIKYAFPAGQKGEVLLEIINQGNRVYQLIVQDNGVGLPSQFDLSKSPSLGLKLVTDLTRQLDGQFRMEIEGGTRFDITFREVHYKERN